MAENIPTGKDRLKEITDSIEQGIRDLFQSDKYLTYLRTMSRFHRYSLNNTILIAMQRPDATLVAGFNKWHDQFERNVMRGEKGIKIIAPTPFKKRVEQEKLDPLTKVPMLDADGRVLTEEKEVTIPMYKVVSVFDVSQTEGSPCPSLPATLPEMYNSTKSLWKPCVVPHPFRLPLKPCSRIWTGISAKAASVSPYVPV